MGSLEYNICIQFYQPILGATSATSVSPADARSSGKLCAFLSCITSIPRFALLRTSPQVGTTLPDASTTDWLKLKPFKVECHCADTHRG